KGKGLSRPTIGGAASALYLPLEGRGIAYGKNWRSACSFDEEASNARSDRSRSDSGLFPIRFLGPRWTPLGQPGPSLGRDSRISICNSPALEGEVKRACCQADLSN